MNDPELGAVKVPLGDIQSLRALFLQEITVQIRYNACHERGWSDSYLLTCEARAVGYGSIKGQEIPDRDTVFEFYVIPPFRAHARALFPVLLSASNASRIECQSNDPLLFPLLCEHAHDIAADVVLFEAGHSTRHTLPGARFRRREGDDLIFEHSAEPVGEFVVELDGGVVATGGFLLHYNVPFADVYMEVHPDHRRKGVGRFLVQEVIRECYEAGRVPAARTGIGNIASRATLASAGLRPCGFMLLGQVNTRAGDLG